jgi:uncharacterized membrane protein
MKNYINIIHRITTTLVAIWMLTAGVSIFLEKEFIHNAIQHLGYPAYFVYILGTAKLFGALFLLLPFPRLFKTLAFSGATIELLSATISYYVIDGNFTEWVKPIVLLSIVWTAYIFWRLREKLPIFE